MSNVFTHKCPNCGGGLTFNPTDQNFQCGFCQSEFTKAEIEASPQPQMEEATLEEAYYICPSCGAEVVTDATTAATDCYYCHNPVVLSDRLSGAFRPDGVIPFGIDQEKAKNGLLEWIGKKKFIPKDFYAKKQVEKVAGVYFPIWYVDCELTGSLSAKATRVRTWQDSRFRYTETSFFQVQRTGEITMHDIPKKALEKEGNQLYESVLPFDMEKRESYTSAYLSGFQAEKRNIESKDLLTETVVLFYISDKTT